MYVEKAPLVEALEWSLKWTEEYMKKVCKPDDPAWQELKRAKHLARTEGEDEFLPLPPGYTRHA